MDAMKLVMPLMPQKRKETKEVWVVSSEIDEIDDQDRPLMLCTRFFKPPNRFFSPRVPASNVLEARVKGSGVKPIRANFGVDDIFRALAMDGSGEVIEGMGTKSDGF